MKTIIAVIFALVTATYFMGTTLYKDHQRLQTLETEIAVIHACAATSKHTIEECLKMFQAQKPPTKTNDIG